MGYLCRRSWLPQIILWASLLGCSPAYYFQSSLQQLSPGWTRQQFLQYFGKGESPILRAARREPDSTVVEVFTLRMVMRSCCDDAVPYWFVFRNGVLQQWGRPEDWASAATTYNINFDPQPGVH